MMENLDVIPLSEENLDVIVPEPVAVKFEIRGQESEKAKNTTFMRGVKVLNLNDKRETKVNLSRGPKKL